MASFFGHAATALALGRVTRLRADAPPPSRRFWLLLVACATVADLDVIGFAFGIRYASQWGHRGFTHSALFAALLALAASTLGFRDARPPSSLWLKRFLVFLVAALSHPLLDMLTNGGLGVALLWPFDDGRYFFPYRPIEVSPIGIFGFVSQRGLEVLQSETYIIFIPCLVAVAFHWAVCTLRRPPRS